MHTSSGPQWGHSPAQCTHTENAVSTMGATQQAAWAPLVRRPRTSRLWVRATRNIFLEKASLVSGHKHVLRCPPSCFLPWHRKPASESWTDLSPSGVDFVYFRNKVLPSTLRRIYHEFGVHISTATGLNTSSWPILGITLSVMIPSSDLSAQTYIRTLRSSCATAQPLIIQQSIEYPHMLVHSFTPNIGVEWLPRRHLFLSGLCSQDT